MGKAPFDIYIVGLGGQGILTIGDLLVNAAMRKNINVNFYPTKGMSQRGGFVQGQLRLGHEIVGASLPPKGADLVIAMERSEALKGIRYVKEQGEFLLFDSQWPTNAVTMGKENYPKLKLVSDEIKKAKARFIYLEDNSLPRIDGLPARANMFILGALLSQTALKNMFTYDDAIEAINNLWPSGAESNLIALKAGFEAPVLAG